jgi:hypothetical protein
VCLEARGGISFFHTKPNRAEKLYGNVMFYYTFEMKIAHCHVMEKGHESSSAEISSSFRPSAVDVVLLFPSPDVSPSHHDGFVVWLMGGGGWIGEVWGL